MTNRQSTNESDTCIQTSIEKIKIAASNFKQSLLELNPWSDKIEYQRQSLRHQYLALVFHSPINNNQKNHSTSSSPFAREALNLIWLDTSHASINIYRQKLVAIDKELAQSNPTSSAHKKLSRKSSRNMLERPPPSTNLGIVARRKIVQHFRSFLRTEDTFWKSLINRLIDEYSIQNAKGCLKVLKILSINDYPTTQEQLEESVPVPISIKDQTISNPNNNSNNNSHRLFQGISLLHKALICFGDLIRYSELYSKTGKHASINNQSRHKTLKNPVLERDWSRSHECYNQARLLIPTDGNPSNQLAVLSSYIPDLLSSAYHYYRALCVKNPFPTARQNLGMTYNKALTTPVYSGPFEYTHDPSGVDSNHLKIDSEFIVSQFKLHFVELHARLYTRAFNSFADFNVKLCSEFSNHLKERLLPPELILKMIVTCMAAAWHARIGWRNAQHHSESERVSATHSYTTELNATIHFLQFSAALFAVSKNELDSIGDLNNTQGQVDLSQNISAVLRRILPSMRIISKWVLCGHFDHISRIKQRLERAKNVKFKSQLSKSEAEFWVQYDESIELIKKHFPINELPSLNDSIQLEEDLELMGFSPIDRAIRSASNSPRFFAIASESCHPNEEHLMRLGDLQGDSDRIEAKYNTMKTQSKSLLITSTQAEVFSRSSSSASDESAEGPVDGVPIESTSNVHEHWIDDEDPVELAMRAVVAQQMDSDDPVDNSLVEFHPFNFGDQIPDENEDEIVCRTTTRANSIEEDERQSAALSRVRISSDSTGKEDFAVGQMSTAADLLASIISGPGPSHSTKTSNNNSPAQTRSTFVASPFAPTTTNAAGWASFERVRSNSQVPGSMVINPARVPSRAPSVSLPKPPEGSNNMNIWSNNNAISSLPSSSAPLSPTIEGRVENDWPTSTAFFG